MFSLQSDRALNSLEALKRAEKAQTRKTAMKKAERKISKSLMARIFTVQIFVESETTATIATFDAKEIKKPIDGRVRGLYLTLSPSAVIQPSLKSLLVAVPNTTTYYLPYRSFPSAFTMTTPAGQGFYISSTIQLGTAFKSIKIQFEYDVDWDVITSEELNTLIGWLNTLRVDRMTVVSQLKASALQYANGYYTNKNSYEAALKGVAGLDAQIAKSNVQVIALTGEIAANDETIKSLLSQIAAKEQTLAALKQQQTDAIGKVSQDDQLITAQTESFKTLGLQKSSGVADTSAFQNQMNNNKDGFISTLNSLKEEYGSDYSNLENARKVVFDTTPPNLNSCNAYLNSATPSY
jgi:hypothetical protein